MSGFETLNASSAPAVVALMNPPFAPHAIVRTTGGGFEFPTTDFMIEGRLSCKLAPHALDVRVADAPFFIPTIGGQVSYRIRGRAIEFDYVGGSLKGAWRRIEFR